MLLNIFSKRQKINRGEIPEVYTYNTLPNPLRVQIVLIMHGVLGNERQYQDQYYGSRKAYQTVVESLCREYGQFQLVELNQYRHRSYQEELSNFILQEPDHERVLDAVELVGKIADTFARRYDFLRNQNASRSVDEALEELNLRFQEHAVGYRFESGEIIRIDSDYIHAETVKPALSLLRDKNFEGAEAEFRSAHEHYRHGRTKETLVECLKAMESVMKAICIKRNWSTDKNANCSTLIRILFENELIPQFWASHFSGLRANLEGGVPTARNKLSGHGQGTAVVEVPNHIATYVLHQTAASIVFLIQADKARP